MEEMNCRLVLDWQEEGASKLKRTIFLFFLKIEIDLDPENRFHSIFACPILRQQSSEDNPPMKLLCGHVISRDALSKLSNGPM